MIRAPSATLFPYTTLFRSNGMVGHKLIERLIATDATTSWEVTVLGEEPRIAYDRVNLSKLFDGSTARSEEHTSELQSQSNLVCRLLLEKKKKELHSI